MKKKNPVPLARNTKIKKAIELFEEFTGHTPQYIDKMDINIPDVGLLVGTCDGLLYSTVRDGKKESYVHEFKKPSRPLLVIGYDGETILVLGGSFKFTEAGISDK